MEAQAKTAIAAFRNGTSKDWTKKRTSIPGVFIVYMPKKEGQTVRPLGIEFNPADEQGNPTKRRGIYIQSAEDLAAMKAAVENPKLDELVAHIVSENPAAPSGKSGDSVVL